MIDPERLPVRPTRCVDCFGWYIRTQGSQQESCLPCQRAGEDHVHHAVFMPRCPKYRVIGESEDMIIIDYLEGFDGIYFS